MFGLFVPKERLKLSKTELERAKNDIDWKAKRNRYYFNALVLDKPAQGIDFADSKLRINEQGRAVYSFRILLACDLKEDLNLKIWFLDPESYVNFFFYSFNGCY